MSLIDGRVYEFAHVGPRGLLRLFARWLGLLRSAQPPWLPGASSGPLRAAVEL